MKKKEFKLNFNKETISNLSGDEMNDVKGGFTFSLSGGGRCQWSNDQTLNVNKCRVEWRASTKVKTICATEQPLP